MGQDDRRLEGWCALVTGGGRGIGRAIALALAGAGAGVAVAARTSGQTEAVARELEARGRRSLSLTVDVGDPAQIESLAREAEARLGPIDILVNAAGESESAPFMKTDLDLWQRTLAVNLTGPFLCIRSFLPGMLERRRGRILNIASTAGLSGFAYVSAYAAAKHGLVGLTRSLAMEVEGKGVTVNALCPGYADTSMTERSVARIAEKTGMSRGEARARLAAMNPSGRLLSPDQIAEAALKILSENGRPMNGEAVVL